MDHGKPPRSPLLTYQGFHSASTGRRKGPPAESTNAESFYYAKQVEAKTPLVFRLRDGTELRGIIEWHDRRSLRVGQEDGSHRILQKLAISYFYKANDEESGATHSASG